MSLLWVSYRGFFVSVAPFYFLKCLDNAVSLYPVYTRINTNASQSFDCEAFVVLGAGTKPIFKEKTKE